MYSPRIREDLIGPIYQKAKATGVAMTTWVNRVVEAALIAEAPEQGGESGAPATPAPQGGKRP